MSAEARAEQESQQTSQVLPLEDAGMSNPHDGGYLACLQVAGSFMLWMNTWYDSSPSLGSKGVEVVIAFQLTLNPSI
jgi:hypothetical protein